MPLNPGVLLGPYTILSLLGKGGMGEVYRARDPRLGREVAIKVLPDSLTLDEEALRRFKREAKSLGAISHPAIVTVYDVGHDQGIFYVVLELLHGETLRSYLSRGKLSEDKAFQFAVGIGEGLSAAHSKGVIHRDLKPENIFISPDGSVKILDFGLAQLKPAVFREEVTGAETESQTGGSVLGTLPYMSPEQVRGESLDARTDIFAFGCVFYEMLTGQSLFRRNESAEIVASILRDDLPDLSALPQHIQRILSHCLEKNRDNRFQTTHDLIFALQSSIPTTITAKSRTTRGIHSAIPWMLLAIVLLGTVYWFYRSRHSPSAKSIAVLPFENLNAANENEYFANGLTEDVISHLSKIHDLRVVSRTSVMRFKNRERNIKDIANLLDVATILEGSVRREGNRIRIVGQLIDAKTDSHLWSETYDRELKDIFEIQTDVALQIAKALRAELTVTEEAQIEKQPTTNLAAYEAYLKGRQHYDLYTTKDLIVAAELFQKAIELDSRFALAHAWLGDVYFAQIEGDTNASPQKAIGSAQRALAVDPLTAEAYIVYGRVHQQNGKYSLALEAYLKAQNLDPNYARAARRVGELYTALGKHDEALRWLTKSVSLDPTASVNHSSLGAAFFCLQDLSNAEKHFLKAAELSPQVPRFTLILLYSASGQAQKARDHFNQMTSLISDPDYNGSFGDLAFELGEKEKAKEYFAKAPKIYDENIVGYSRLLIDQGKKNEAYALIDAALQRKLQAIASHERIWIDSLQIAHFNAARSNHEETYRSLEETINLGGFVPTMASNPIFKEFHGEKRFQDLIARGRSKAAEQRRRAEQNTVD